MFWPATRNRVGDTTKSIRDTLSTNAAGHDHTRPRRKRDKSFRPLFPRHRVQPKLFFRQNLGTAPARSIYTPCPGTDTGVVAGSQSLLPVILAARAGDRVRDSRVDLTRIIRANDRRCVAGRTTFYRRRVRAGSSKSPGFRPRGGARLRYVCPGGVSRIQDTYRGRFGRFSRPWPHNCGLFVVVVVPPFPTATSPITLDNPLTTAAAAAARSLIVRPIVPRGHASRPTCPADPTIKRRRPTVEKLSSGRHLRTAGGNLEITVVAIFSRPALYTPCVRAGCLPPPRRAVSSKSRRRLPENGNTGFAIQVQKTRPSNRKPPCFRSKKPSVRFPVVRPNRMSVFTVLHYYDFACSRTFCRRVSLRICAIDERINAQIGGKDGKLKKQIINLYRLQLT